MALDSNGNKIAWANSKQPARVIFDLFHVSVVLGVIAFIFVPNGKYVLAAWIIIDVLFRRYDLTLRAAMMRCRLWFRGGVRKSTIQ